MQKPLSPAWVSHLEWNDFSLWERAARFLKELNSRDVIAILYDEDGDGISSAAIASIGVERIRGKAPDHIMPFPRSTEFVSSGLPQDLRRLGVTKLITLDRKVDQAGADFLQRLAKTCDVLIVDHHHSTETSHPSNMIAFYPDRVWKTTSSNFPTAILAFTLFSGACDLHEKDWIACIGIISDSSYRTWKPFVDASVKKWGFSPIGIDPFISGFGEMSQTIYAIGSLNRAAFPDFLELLIEADSPKAILDSDYRLLREIIEAESNKWFEEMKKTMSFFPEMQLHLGKIKPRHSVKSLVINRLSHELFPNETVVLMQEVPGEKILISARRQDGKIPLNEVIEQCVQGLPEANGGGHIQSSAAIIQKQDEVIFVKRLKELLSKKYKLPD